MLAVRTDTDHPQLHLTVVTEGADDEERGPEDVMTLACQRQIRGAMPKPQSRSPTPDKRKVVPCPMKSPASWRAMRWRCRGASRARNTAIGAAAA